ncbi:hypothetical protein DPSP01_000469 [Paraphaeosphaeria sporulosa]
MVRRYIYGCGLGKGKTQHLKATAECRGRVSISHSAAQKQPQARLSPVLTCTARPIVRSHARSHTTASLSPGPRKAAFETASQRHGMGCGASKSPAYPAPRPYPPALPQHHQQYYTPHVIPPITQHQHTAPHPQQQYNASYQAYATFPAQGPHSQHQTYVGYNGRPYTIVNPKKDRKKGRKGKQYGKIGEAMGELLSSGGDAGGDGGGGGGGGGDGGGAAC